MINTHDIRKSWVWGDLVRSESLQSHFLTHLSESDYLLLKEVGFPDTDVLGYEFSCIEGQLKLFEEIYPNVTSFGVESNRYWVLGLTYGIPQSVIAPCLVLDSRDASVKLLRKISGDSFQELPVNTSLRQFWDSIYILFERTGGLSEEYVEENSSYEDLKEQIIDNISKIDPIVLDADDNFWQEVLDYNLG